jgi:hypothetical protein
MGEPPSDGAVHDTKALLLPATPVTPVGAPGPVAAVKLYRSDVTTLEIPWGPSTSTFTGPTKALAGATASISVAETTVNCDAAALPNVTLVTPAKCAPLIFTLPPPQMGPSLGVRADTAGAFGEDDADRYSIVAR